jgi:adenylyltransferase/sulfurtransferase
MQRWLIVGAGGLGCAAGRALAKAARSLPPFEVTVVDDDTVAATNLHRQAFYVESDVGASKARVYAERFTAMAKDAGAQVRVTALEQRVGPSHVRELVRAHDIVLEGSDNFATKFLCADAAFLENVRIVHAGVVRWAGYALSSGEGRGCYRCMFEDMPEGLVDTCSEAGVVGPLVGVVGALQAWLMTRVACGEREASVVQVDAMRGGAMRPRLLRPRDACALCGDAPTIQSIDSARYAMKCALA